MNILEKNLSVTEFRTIYTGAASVRYPLEQSRGGSATYKIGGIYIHSKYDPLKEAERTAAFLTEEADDVDVYIIFGGGLGYVANVLYEQVLVDAHPTSAPYVIYVEKDIASFRTALEVTDFSAMIQHEHFKIFIAAEKEQIGSFIQSIPTQRVRYYYHRPLFALSEEYYRELQNYITYVLDRKDMNTATLTRFQKVWARNMIYNVPFLPYTHAISELRGIGEGAAALIVAGGPTLEQMLSFLIRHEEELIIIAVDTAYGYLTSHGVTPDIVVSIDPQYWNYKYLENTTLEGSLLVTDQTCYYKIFRNIESRRICTGNSLFPLSGFFMDTADRGVLAAGGSVSTTAFDIARQLGVKTIILAGLDLGFPDYNTHFKGAFFETNFISSSDYLHPTEQKSVMYITHAGLVTVPATHGMVTSDPKMVLFRRWFEREIPLTNAQVLLPDLGGSMIAGASVVPFEQLDTYVTDAEKASFRQKMDALISRPPVLSDPAEYHHKITLFADICKMLRKRCKEIVALLPASGEVSDKSACQFEVMEKTIFSTEMEKKVAGIVSSSAQDMLLSIMENIKFDDDEKKSVWIKTRKLYEKIGEMAEFYENNFEKLIKIMKAVPKI